MAFVAGTTATEVKAASVGGLFSFKDPSELRESSATGGPNGSKREEDMETIVGIGLALPLGVFLNYRWRDRISQQRRAQYLAERFVREQREALERERKAKASSGNSIDLG